MPWRGCIAKMTLRMHKVQFSKQFKKQYKKLPRPVQLQFDVRFELWLQDPSHPLLRLHRLKGKLRNLYSINVNADVRAIYEIVGDEIYIYKLIGTHTQLYS